MQYRIIDLYALFLLQKLEYAMTFTQEVLTLENISAFLCDLGISEACKWLEVFTKNEIKIIALDVIIRDYIYEIENGLMTEPAPEIVEEYAKWKKQVELTRAHLINLLNEILGGRTIHVKRGETGET